MKSQTTAFLLNRCYSSNTFCISSPYTFGSRIKMIVFYLKYYFLKLSYFFLTFVYFYSQFSQCWNFNLYLLRYDYENCQSCVIMHTNESCRPIFLFISITIEKKTFYFETLIKYPKIYCKNIQRKENKEYQPGELQ